MKMNEKQTKRLIKPKEYLEGKITPANCQHLVIEINGFDDYSNSCKCLICKDRTNYSRRDSSNDRYISSNFGFLTPYRNLVLETTLSLVFQAYENEEAIDIVAILNKLNLEKIEKTIKNSTNQRIKRLINIQKSVSVTNAKNS
jgi:hypothetical protein